MAANLSRGGGTHHRVRTKSQTVQNDPGGDFRKCLYSLLIRHGESVKVVQMRLGHATAAETLDTYSHLWPDSEDRTRDAVDAVLGASADSLRTEKGS